MDKETRDRYYQIVGGLQTLEHIVKRSTCMPCDYTTDALLAVARYSIEQAVISASRYADEKTANEK